MAVEEIELRLTVDGRPAQKALEQTRSMAERLGGGLGTVIGSMDGLQKSSQALQQKLAPTAAAISGVSSALGQAGGEAGKVVAGVGQMAAAFGAGGPWAVAIVGGTMLLDSYLAAQKNVEENARLTKQAMESLGDTLVNKSAKGLDAIREKANAAAEAVRNFGKTAQQIDVDAARTEIALTEKRIRGLDDLIERRQKIAQAIREEPQAENRQELIERLRRLGEEAVMIRSATDKREELTRTLKAQQDETRRLIAEQERLNKKEAESPTTGETGRAAAGPRASDGRFSSAALQARIVAGIAKQQEAEAKVREAYTNRSIDMWERSARIWEAQEQQKTAILEEEEAKRVAIAQEATEARFAAEQKFVDMFGELVQQSTVNSISATQDYLDAKITGEEDAEIKLLASFLRTQGQMLVGVGTRGLFEGALLATNPVTAPQGVAMMAIGGAAVAQGVAMGAAGTAISHVAAGGTIGQALPTESTSGRSSDPGARARPSSGRMGGDSGGQAITIIYGGISGPSADDGARALRRASRRADKRGFA